MIDVTQSGVDEIHSKHKIEQWILMVQSVSSLLQLQISHCEKLPCF